MLTLALAAALIGFGLLVAALITSNFWIAVACVIVCAVGLILLVWDILRSGRRDAGVDDPPLFTIRDQAPENRSKPLIDDKADKTAQVGDDWADRDVVRPGTAAADPVDSGPIDSGPIDTSVSGLGGIVDTAAVPVAEEPLVTGDAHDYIKSITGSFPVQAPVSGPRPVARPPMPDNRVPDNPVPEGPVPSNPFAANAVPSNPVPVAPAPRAPEVRAPEVDQPEFDQPEVSEPEFRATEHAPAPVPPVFPPATAAAPGEWSNPDTGPIPVSSPYVGRRRRADGQPVAPAPVDESPSAEISPAPEQPVAAPESSRITAPKPASELGGDSIVVHDHTGPLPKITIVDP